MRKVSMKTKTLLAMSALSVACLLCGGVVVRASAEEITPANASFAMAEGASVRATVNADNDSNGIRYSITMPEAQYTELTANYDVSFGILIAPASYDEANELNEANVFGENAVYDWATLVNGEWVYNGTKTQIINFETTTMVADTEKAGQMIYHGSMVALHENNIAREFIGKGYMKYTDGDTVKYEWADEKDNVRSMAYVAQMAVNDDEVSEAQKTILNTLYLNKLAGTSVNYTVEHYTENAPGSEQAYTLANTETLSGTFNTTVEGTPKTFEGFTYDEEKSVATGLALANGKLTLKLYYTKDVDVLSALNFSNGYDAKIATADFSAPVVVDDEVAADKKALKVEFGYADNDETKTFTIDLGGAYKLGEIESVVMTYRFAALVTTAICWPSIGVNKMPSYPSEGKQQVAYLTATVNATYQTVTLTPDKIKTFAGATDEDTLDSLSMKLLDYKPGFKLTMYIDSIVVKEKVDMSEFLKFGSDASLEFVTAPYGETAIVDDSAAVDGKALQASFVCDDSGRKNVTISLGSIYTLGEVESITVSWRFAETMNDWPSIKINTATTDKTSDVAFLNGSSETYTASKITAETIKTKNGLTDEDILKNIIFTMIDYKPNNVYTILIDSIVITLK